MAKIGHHAKAIAFAKSSLWVKNQNCQKHAKNNSTTTLELFCAKKTLQKTPNIQKKTTFQKWPNWPLCKGYSLWKIVTFGQNLNFKEHAKNNRSTTLELFGAKTRSKKHLIFEKLQSYQNGQYWRPCKKYSLCQIVTLSQKLKLSKAC